jgi:molybdenum-dependent DNA-binding transcriptional regulator ModE
VTETISERETKLKRNRICEGAAVETREGGKYGGGAKLTVPSNFRPGHWCFAGRSGSSLVAHYRKIEHSVEKAARKELLALRADIGKPKGKGASH